MAALTVRAAEPLAPAKVADDELDLAALPTELADILRGFDESGDGKVSREELQEAAETVAAAHRAAKDGILPLTLFPKELRPALTAIDADGSGEITSGELAAAAALLAERKASVKRMKKAVVVLSTVGAAFFAACFAVMIAAGLAVEKATRTMQGASGTLQDTAGKTVRTAGGGAGVVHTTDVAVAASATGTAAQRALYTALFWNGATPDEGQLTHHEPRFLAAHVPFDASESSPHMAMAGHPREVAARKLVLAAKLAGEDHGRALAARGLADLATVAASAPADSSYTALTTLDVSVVASMCSQWAEGQAVFAMTMSSGSAVEALVVNLKAADLSQGCTAGALPAVNTTRAGLAAVKFTFSAQKVKASPVNYLLTCYTTSAGSLCPLSQRIATATASLAQGPAIPDKDLTAVAEILKKAAQQGKSAADPDVQASIKKATAALNAKPTPTVMAKVVTTGPKGRVLEELVPADTLPAPAADADAAARELAYSPVDMNLDKTVKGPGLWTGTTDFTRPEGVAFPDYYQVQPGPYAAGVTSISVARGVGMWTSTSAITQCLTASRISTACAAPEIRWFTPNAGTGQHAFLDWDKYTSTGAVSVDMDALKNYLRTGEATLDAERAPLEETLYKCLCAATPLCWTGFYGQSWRNGTRITKSYRGSLGYETTVAIGGGKYVTTVVPTSFVYFDQRPHPLESVAGKDGGFWTIDVLGGQASADDSAWFLGGRDIGETASIETVLSSDATKLMKDYVEAKKYGYPSQNKYLAADGSLTGLLSLGDSASFKAYMETPWTTLETSSRPKSCGTTFYNPYTNNGPLDKNAPGCGRGWGQNIEAPDMKAYCDTSSSCVMQFSTLLTDARIKKSQYEAKLEVFKKARNTNDYANWWRAKLAGDWTSPGGTTMSKVMAGWYRDMWSYSNDGNKWVPTCDRSGAVESNVQYEMPLAPFFQVFSATSSGDFDYKSSQWMDATNAVLKSTVAWNSFETGLPKALGYLATCHNLQEMTYVFAVLRRFYAQWDLVESGGINYVGTTLTPSAKYVPGGYGKAAPSIDKIVEYFSTMTAVERAATPYAEMLRLVDTFNAGGATAARFQCQGARRFVRTECVDSSTDTVVSTAGQSISMEAYFASGSGSNSNSASASQTPSTTASASQTPSTTASATPTGSTTPSLSSSMSQTPTPTPTGSDTPTPSSTGSDSGTPTPSITPSNTATPSATPSVTRSRLCVCA